MKRAPDLLNTLQKNWKTALGWGLGLALPLFSAFVAHNWWLVIWSVGPALCLEIVPWPSWHFLRGTGYKQPEIRTGWLFGSLIFLLLIIGLAFTPALNHGQRLIGYEDFTHRDWLGLGALDDPTYRLARRAPVGHRLVVVTLHESEAEGSVRTYRYDLLQKIRTAYNNDATGVALDFYFAAEDPEADEMFSRQIREMESASGGLFRVFAGYHIRHFDTPAGPILAARAPPRTLSDVTMQRRGFGDVDPGWTDPEGADAGTAEAAERPLRGYLGFRNFGHLYAFTEASGKVRSMPLGFSGHASHPALCVRIAEHVRRAQGRIAEPPSDGAMGARVPEPLKTPPGGLLYFVPPRTPLLHLHADDFAVLDETGELAELLRGRFVIFGTEGGRDMKLTPFYDKEIPGVFMHAYGAEALLSEHWVVRGEWWYALLGAILPIMSLATRFSRRRSLRGILFSNVALTLIVVAVSGVIIVISNVWIDVSYAIVAIWSFFALGLGAQRIEVLLELRRRASAARSVG